MQTLVKIGPRDVPTDTIAQSEEHLRDKPRAWVQIQGNVRFFICSVVFYLLCCPFEVLEGPILTGVSIIQ